MTNLLVLESIENRIAELLDSLDIEYTHGGITANLNAWNENKQTFLNLFRKHPEWNENELAIILPLVVDVPIDKLAVNKAMGEFEVNVISDSGLLRTWDNNICPIINEFTPYISPKMANFVKEKTGIKVRSGEKTTTVLSNLFKQNKFDTLPGFPSYSNKLLQLLSPKTKVDEKIVISINPLDFLTMGSRSNPYESCHLLTDGCHKAGSLSLMNDSASFIVYTVNKDNISDYYQKSKITRQLFMYNGNTLFQSHLYLSGVKNLYGLYSDIVKTVINKCEGIKNRWEEKEGFYFEKYLCNHRNALHYSDYIHSNKGKRIFQKESDINKITVGFTSYCLECEDKISDSDQLYCDYHAKYVNYCYDCGERVRDDDAYWVDDEIYCQGCVSWCEHCNRSHRDDPISAYLGGNKYTIEICNHCYESDFCTCEKCGEVYHRDLMTYSEYDYFCNDCYTDNFSLCAECGEVVENTDFNNEEGLCNDCYENKELENAS